MYGSKPKEREGKPLEFVVPEAIESTASREGDHSEVGARLPHTPGSAPVYSPLAFAAVAALAVIEALVIILLLAF